MTQPLSALELFAGAGGLALGTHKAGFQHLGLVEWDSIAAETLRLNSERILGIDPHLILQADAASINFAQYLGAVDLLTAGPPCQPFSNAGRKRGAEDSRNMFPVLFSAIAASMPKAVLVENVYGLAQTTFQDYFQYLMRQFQFPLLRPKPEENWRDHNCRLSRTARQTFKDDERYQVSFQLVDTADYGVPQRRRRVLFVAFRSDLGLEPFSLAPTHSREALLVSQWITGDYWEKRGIRPYDFLTEKDKAIVKKLRRNGNALISETAPWVTVRDAIGDLPTPVLRGEPEIVLNHVQHPGARRYRNHTGSLYDYPAKALKAGTHGTPGGENMLQVSIDHSNESVRYFTTREAARLHTFPDEWHFIGTWGACIRQLGNAVPVDLAHRFADEIHVRLSRTLK